MEDIKQYSRKIRHHGPKLLKSKTVNLSSTNAKKITRLNVYLSMMVRDYIDSKTSKQLTALYSSDLCILKDNQERIVSSVTLRLDQLPKIVGINLTVLVNDLIRQL